MVPISRRYSRNQKLMPNTMVMPQKISAFFDINTL
jgi:hypothetical protein